MFMNSSSLILHWSYNLCSDKRLYLLWVSLTWRMLIFNTTGSQPVSGGSKPYRVDLAEFIVHNHYFCQDLSQLTVIISILDYLFIFISLKDKFDVWDLHKRGHLMNLVYKISFKRQCWTVHKQLSISHQFFLHTQILWWDCHSGIWILRILIVVFLMTTLFHLVPIIICLCCILYLGFISRVSGVYVLEGF